jgi:arylsulfatase B
MKGGKGSNYDGGHRVPLFLHWPAGGFKEERRIKTLTGHIDIFPTLLDLCGMEKPEGVKMDGISIRPLLEKGDHKDWPARMMMTDNQKKHLPSKWATTTVMSERWRLIDNKELYDIDADPGQRSNVIDKHPEVVQQLRKYYDELWADLQPGLNNVPMIPLAAPDQKTVALNYHDCVNRHPFWFQNDIRRIAKHIDPPKNKRAAFWPVEVVAEGEYSIELRRWPVEIDHPIHADLPPGAPVYGGKAHRSTPGAGFPAIKATLSVGDQQLTAPVDRDAKAVVFKTRLPAGAHRISAKFYDAEDRSLDAFYLYVTKAATPQ